MAACRLPFANRVRALLMTALTRAASSMRGDRRFDGGLEAEGVSRVGSERERLLDVPKGPQQLARLLAS